LRAAEPGNLSFATKREIDQAGYYSPARIS
jgi:hypothetical protein